MPTTTRAQLEIDILNKWNPRFDEVLGRFTMPQTTTAIAADKTSLRDTLLGRGTVAANNYDGRQIEIVELVTGGPAIGEVAGIDNGGFDQIDKFTLSPEFSDEVQTGTDYLLYGRGLSPEMTKAAISAVLRNTEGPHLWFPSMIDDAAFDENDITNWPAAGSPSTREFTAIPSGSSLLGERVLTIAAGSVGEGADSSFHTVAEGEQLLVSVLTQVVLDSVQVSLFNISASSDIRAVVEDSQDIRETRFTESIPSGCESVKLRFLAPNITVVFNILPPVVMQSLSGRSYLAPSWFTRPEQFVEALYVPPGIAGEVDYSRVALSSRFRAAPAPRFLRQARGVNELFVELAATSAGPVCLVVQRTFDELSSSTATTSCDREYVMWKALANILRAKDEPAWASYDRTAMGIAHRLSYGVQERRMVENEQIMLYG
jgi:hypothetical protein